MFENTIDDNMNKFSTKFIGIVDIMGFKNLVKNARDGLKKVEHMDKVEKTLDSCYNQIKYLWDEKSRNKGSPTETIYFRSTGDPGNPILNKQYWEYIKKISKSMYIFSDTIFYYLDLAEDEKEQYVQLHAMTSITNSLIILPVLFSNHLYQIPNRGAIALGEVLIDKQKNIFAGDPIIDADELCKAQDWMGAALHDSLNHLVEIGNSKYFPLVDFDQNLYEYKNKILKAQYSNSKNIKYYLNWYQSHRAMEEYCPEIKKYKKSRPLWKDIMDGNINYMQWEKETSDEEQKSAIRKKRVNTESFAREIDNKFNESDEYGRI